VIALRKEDEELTRRDPQLAAWVRMRRRLEAADGEAYFAESFKGKAQPRLKGTLVRATPEGKPQELGISVTDGRTEEIVVKLATAFPNAAEVGVAVLEFEGVLDSFVKSPMGVVVMAEREQVSGWPAPVKSRR
jgi:hypothetical protein